MKELIATQIYTLHGFAKENVFPGIEILDVGCGQRKLPGALGMDIVSDSHADVVHDVNKTPWPFSGNNFDIILLNHVLEHVDDVLAALGEVHRVGKPGSRVVIQVPYFRSIDAFNDPTHRHFFTARSLDYFFGDTKLAEYQYVSFMFRKIGFWYGWPHESKNPLVHIVKQLMHHHAGFYDQYLSLIFPVKCLTWELEIVK